MTSLTLPANLGIESANALHQQLAAYLHQNTSAHIDASAVSRIHSASIQVLCAWVRARHQRGYETVFSAASNMFTDAAHLLGVAPCLSLTPSPTVEKTHE